MDLNKIPKQYCENVVAARSQESFTLGLLAGEHGAFFAFSPQHFKRLVQNLSFQLAEYEKEYGAVDAQWIPGAPSPIQTSDVMRGNDKKEE